MRALDRKLLRTLWRFKGQVVAVAGVVACGIAMFVMALTTLEALRGSRDAFYAETRFAEVFATVKRAPESLVRRIAALPGVETASSRIVAGVLLDIPGMIEPASGRVLSLPPPHGLNQLVLRRGRLPVRAGEVAVTEAFADAHHFSLGAGFSVLLNGRKRAVTVVGVVLSPEYTYSVAPGLLMPDDRRFGALWMVREGLEAAFDLDGAFNDLTLTLARGASLEETLRRLDGVLDRHGGVGAYGREDQVSHALLSGEIDQLAALSRMIPPVFLGIAAFLLQVMLSRLVAIERPQIGLLKALGYDDGQVARHYLALALVIVTLGAAVGIAAGLWLALQMASLYAQFYHLPRLVMRPDAWVLAGSGAIALATGLAASWQAVRRVARLPPAEAMRPAPPASYHRALPRLTALLTPPSRIILRNILRWPVRSALTVLGIALALADMVASLFAFDSVERMIELTFFAAQRYEAQVTFTEPQPARARFDLDRLPGVIAAETFRVVGVRLHHGPRSERTQLTGLPPDSRLRRLVDADLVPHDLPAHGLVISPILARTLAASPGDVLQVEVLEGRRPSLWLPVVAVVEDYLGSPAYMDRRRLARLLDEDELASGGWLLVDAAAREALYRTVKRTPDIAAITLRSATVESFRRTMADSMYVTLFFYIGFGGSIALGVLYNSARIALSERARDLALLRALGYSDLEVSYILLGELALLTLLALPLGCLLGYGWATAIVTAFENDMFLIPLVIGHATYGIAIAVVLVAAVVSGLLVHRRIAAMDVVAMLKTAE